MTRFALVDRMIRVGSYNIQKAIGLDARRRPERILEVIAEFDPDIVALQEADRRFGERRSALPPGLLAEIGDHEVVPVTPAAHSIGWHGNAILMRRPMRVRSTQRWRLPQLEPRGAVSVTLETDSGPLRIVGVHLSLVGTMRKQQFGFLMKQLAAEEGDVPTVVLGDFNEWRRPAGKLVEFPPGYRELRPGRSFPSPLPVAPLDRIVISAGLTAHGVGVHRSRRSRIASDHLPVWADLSLG